MIRYMIGGGVIPMKDNFTEERILALAEIIRTTDSYDVPHVPGERVNEILWRLRPDAPCTVKVDSCTLRKANYFLHFENHGVVKDGVKA